MRKSQFICALMITMALSAINVYAGTATCNDDNCTSGFCGTGCTYVVTQENGVKTMTITGTGENANVNEKAFSRNYDSYGNEVLFGSDKDKRFDRIENVVVTGTISSIGSEAFRANNLTSVTIPNSVTSIGDNAFRDNNLTSVTIPNSVTEIGGYVFYGNNLTSVTIPDSVTSIGSGAFPFNNLTSVTIPDSVTSIGAGAFSNNNLTSVTIPNSVTSIGGRAFWNNQLASVTIPDSVTYIGIWAFEDNRNLSSIIIGDGVTSILEGAFKNTPDNMKIYCQDTTENRCSALINKNNSDQISKLVLFQKDENGIYKVDDKYYASADLMQNGVACDNKKQCESLLASAQNGTFSFGSKFYASLDDLASGNHIVKRIYTIDEANQVAGKTNTFSIRYR